MPHFHLGDETNYGKLTWAPPALTNPLTITLTNDANGRKAMMDPTRDYIVRCPEPITVSDGIELNGGRNVVLIGGAVNFTQDYNTATGNRCLFIKGNAAQTQARTVHVEGLRFSGIIKEGINVDQQAFNGGEPNLTVTLQNINAVDPLLGSFASNHADFFQGYNGPSNLRIDRAFCGTQYQGFMLQPHQNGTAALGTYELRHIYVEGLQDSGALLYLVTGQASDRPTIVTDRVYLKPAPNKPNLNQVVLENPAFWGDGVRLAPQGKNSPISAFPGVHYRSPGYV